MLHLYAACYRGYVAIFQPPSKSNKTPQTKHAAVIDTQDSKATLLGDAYRGSGVLVGILGSLIVFCAVAPFGFGVGGTATAQYFGIAELALMIWVIQIILYVRRDKQIKADLKTLWLAQRAKAEIDRYKPIQDIENESLPTIRMVIEPLLGLNTSFNDDQIKYNERSAEKYHAIEHAAERATLIGFGISLSAATVHLLLHLDALIFLTAFLPAAVGALHGINAFLRLELLSEDHHWMAEQLKLLRTEFLQAFERNEIDRVRELAKRTHELLSTGHREWHDIARKLEVKAP